ncbi:MAG: hypothetical protein HY918_04820 [Candidatus Doudnabacteria bacterium]|nr:hypothetical protein [Candidatus Doudnabacteria bacterium]
MEISVEQQIFDQFKRAAKIAVVLPEHLTADSVATGLALKLFLQKLQKEVVICSSGEMPLNLRFLPQANSFQKQVSQGSSFVISVDTAVKKLDEVSYQKREDKVQIYLKSLAQEFDQNDLNFSLEKSPLDLIVAVGGKSLEDFGRIYEQSADRFFETPKINIDHKPGNEYFGTINLVDITATSTAEILTELFQKYEEQLVDEDIATCLLAGIIEKTASFQHVQTTPKAFIKASELISFGGRQQEIIKNIFKTKSLPLLKLWGRALARMKVDEGAGLVHSVLALSDFEKSESNESEILPVLREFVDNISGYKIIAVIAEAQKNQPHLVVAVHEQVPAAAIMERLGASAKLMNFQLGNYKIIEQSYDNATLENIESRFLGIVKS